MERDSDAMVRISSVVSVLEGPSVGTSAEFVVVDACRAVVSHDDGDELPPRKRVAKAGWRYWPCED